MYGELVVSKVQVHSTNPARQNPPFPACKTCVLTNGVVDKLSLTAQMSVEHVKKKEECVHLVSGVLLNYASAQWDEGYKINRYEYIKRVFNVISWYQHRGPFSSCQ